MHAEVMSGVVENSQFERNNAVDNAGDCTILRPRTREEAKLMCT